MEELSENIRQKQSKPLFIVSDFHGVYDAIDLVKDKLSKKTRRVVILGDCMDRGNGGIKLLAEIKEMIENGEDIMYLPGNHDDALYTKFRHFTELYKENNNKEITEEMITIFRSYVKASKLDVFAKENGQIPTFNEIIDMTSTPEGLKKFFELMIWLEEQPLLRIETDCDGRKIALGHAAFDMDLYSMEEPITLSRKALIEKRLEELSNAQDSEEFKETNRKQKKVSACLWYRNPYDKDSSNYNGVVRLPDESEADVIVVGHTPRQEEVEIIGENIRRKAIVVDGGTVRCYLSGEGQMLKFEPFREGLPSKTMVTAFVVAGKKGAYEKLGLMDEYEEEQNEQTDSKTEPQIEEDDSDMKVYVPRKKKPQNFDPDDNFGDI